MLNLEPIGSNQSEVTIDNHDTGTCLRVLFSYKTPVAAFVNNRLVKTSKKWSATTSRHINAWIDGREVEEEPQEFFDNILSEIS